MFIRLKMEHTREHFFFARKFLENRIYIFSSFYEFLLFFYYYYLKHPWYILERNVHIERGAAWYSGE